MKRAAAIVVAAALLAPASHAGERAYDQSARVRYIAAALAAIRASSPEALAGTYRYLEGVERSQCKAPLHSLEINCILEAARQSCARRDEAERQRCHRVSDVIADVHLGAEQLLTREVRLAIMREHTEYRPVLERELRRRHAALVIEMTMKTPPSPGGDALAAAIDGYCRAVAGTRELSWQHCAAAIIWFIGTSEASRP